MISTDEGQSYAAEHGISFTEASALNSSNVESAFLQILTEIYQKKAKKEQEAHAASTVQLAAAPDDANKKKAGGCC
eukprot:6205451-Pleurochrysis_carterae.AAC.1